MTFIMTFSLIQWKKMVQGFRSGMPVCKHRIRMKTYDKSFTGTEAVHWLKDYLLTSGLFQSVNHQQVCTTRSSMKEFYLILPFAGV